MKPDNSRDRGVFQFSPLRIAGALVIVGIAIALWITSRSPLARSSSGEFQFNGISIQEFHCFATGVGRHPAVILIHGAGYRGLNYDMFDSLCGSLADHGYDAELLEYYDSAANSDQMSHSLENFKTWTVAIHSGIEALGRNPAVDPKRIALMGFSQGAFLAVGTAAQYPDEVAALVEYYGGLFPQLRDKAASLPPTLIIHGEKDAIIPVAEAKDLDALLTKAHRPHEMYLYPSAEHGFNFHRPGNFFNPEATADAWRRTLDFLDRTLKPAPSS